MYLYLLHTRWDFCLFSRGGFFFFFFFFFFFIIFLYFFVQYLRKRMREKRERKEKVKGKKRERKGKELWNCNTTYAALPPVWDACCVGFFLSSLVEICTYIWGEAKSKSAAAETVPSPSLSLSLSLLCRLCGLLDPWVLGPGLVWSPREWIK